MTKRDRMKKAAAKNPHLWPNYKGLRNQCTSAIRKAIQDYYHGLIEETKDELFIWPIRLFAPSFNSDMLA